MESIPPSYVVAVGDAPPSYEEVARRVDQLVGTSPTPQKYLDVAKSLSDAERQVLVDGAAAKNPVQSDEDKRKLAVGMAKTLSSDDATERLKQDATIASSAALAIKTAFDVLEQEIAVIDQIEKSTFFDELVALKNVCVCGGAPSPKLFSRPPNCLCRVGKTT